MKIPIISSVDIAFCTDISGEFSGSSFLFSHWRSLTFMRPYWGRIKDEALSLRNTRLLLEMA